MVTKQNHMQAAIKSMRKEVAEQGGGGNQGAFEKKDGTFGGMTRVLEGFVKQNDEFKCVPKATRRFVNSNTSAIREANKKGGAIVKRELSTQQTEADAKVTTQIPVEKRMMPSQLTIDSKLASMKAAAFKKFGGNNLSAKTFIKERQTQKWIQKRKVGDKVDEDEKVSRKNIQFAKDLFISWDDHGTGTLKPDDIIKPLVELGLAPNSDFANMILKALDPRSKEDRSDEDLKLTLADFIKIFKSSKVSDSLLNIIQRQSEKRYLKNQQALMINELPERRFDHPSITDPASDLANQLFHKHREGGKRNYRQQTESDAKRQVSRKHMSISMRSKHDQAIVEFPIQSHRKGQDSSKKERDELHPTFDSQVIIHQQYLDRANNKQIRASNTYRIRDKEKLQAPVETEYEKMEDTHYLNMTKTPSMNTPRFSIDSQSGNKYGLNQ